jgi:acyl-CoA thioesterase
MEASKLDSEGFGHVVLWCRRGTGQPFNAASIAYAADMVPIAVARAAGRMGAGSSLDNSMRFGEVGCHEWVLLELAGDFAHGGYGHGSLRAWGSDGTLLATGSQTTNMRYLFDEDEQAMQAIVAISGGVTP